MAKPCSICGHLRRAQIDAALAGGASLSTTAALFGVGRSSLDRHRHRCASQALVAELAPPNQQMWAPGLQPVAPAAAVPALMQSIEELRAEAIRTRPSPDQHLAFASFLVAQAGAKAFQEGDIAGMVRAAKEARNIARLDLDTAEERARLAARPPQIDRLHLMLTAILGDEDDEAWAEEQLGFTES